MAYKMEVNNKKTRMVFKFMGLFASIQNNRILHKFFQNNLHAFLKSQSLQLARK